MRSTRRAALKALGVTIGVAAFRSANSLANTASSSAVVPRRSADKAPVTEAAPLADLAGARLATSTVTNVGAIELGTIPVTFVDSQGESFVVEVLRHDPARPGVARAGSLAVYLRVGRNQRATYEGHGLAAMALAAELAGREAGGSPVPALLTLTEREPVRTSWNRRQATTRVG